MPRPIPSAPPTRHTADAAGTRADLAVLRPDLIGRYDAELPGARAAVLARLLGAVDREQLPGLVRTSDRSATIKDGKSREMGRLRYPAAAGKPFAVAEAGLTVYAETAAGETGYAETGAIDDPGDLVRLLWPTDKPAGEPADGLAAEIDNSVANLALARAGRRERDPGERDPDTQGSGTRGSDRRDPGTRDLGGLDLGRLEQLVTDGHPLHPCCRTRGAMSVSDVLAYAPEHSPVIRLRRLRVPEGRWYGTAPPVLLAHPWQADRLRDAYPWLADDGETGPVRPLMSLRTVAPLDGGPHVKTAVDVQMTSAVRTVSPAAVHNGPVLSALLAKLTADLPLGVLAETAAGAVLVDGRPDRHLAYLTRQAPALAEGETAVPIAVLSAAPMLLSGGFDAYEIMVLLGDVLFAPLMSVLARGVALEAHGQNTLVVLRDGRPVRTLYRDLGGVRVSAARLARAGVAAPELHGDLPSDDPQVLRTKLAAAAFGTVAAELVATLSRHRDGDPDRLWGIVAAAIRGTPDGRAMITEPLPVKATTAMRLAADPLQDLWARLDNPMAAHA